MDSLGPQKGSWLKGFGAVAKRTKATVICVGLAYDDMETNAWVGDIGFLPHFWLNCKRTPHRIRLEFEIIDCSAKDSTSFVQDAESLCAQLSIKAKQHLDGSTEPERIYAA